MIQVCEPYEEKIRQGGAVALRLINEFFGLDNLVFKTFYWITTWLNENEVPYAVTGEMAMAAHGCSGTTAELEIVVTLEGLAEINRRIDANQTNRIKFLIAGDYTSGGQPRLVAFPNPADSEIEIDSIRFLRIESLVELKLASGMTGGVNRLKDLADVVELIKVMKFPADFADRLNAYTREKFLELRNGVHDTVMEEE